jgi:beta-phosphoglucomutase family hydrolase
MLISQKYKEQAAADMLDRFDAWLFDLDGVITDTARIHAKAWKEAFDDFLRQRSTQTGEPFREFTTDHDYPEYVDGKPRYEGVDSFLRSRGIEQPWGDVNDPPEADTVCGIGNRKNVRFNEILKTDGADLFETSVELIKVLKSKGKRIAVVTSSKNCTAVLESVGLKEMFDVQFDGIYAAEHKVAGKPKPDTYLEAARLLGSTADKSVVIEDALSGVEAGRAGNFGLTLGVDRHGEPEKLLQSGADIVVSDLGELLEKQA